MTSLSFTVAFCLALTHCITTYISIYLYHDFSRHETDSRPHLPYCLARKTHPPRHGILWSRQRGQSHDQNLVEYLRRNGVNVAVVAPAISVGQKQKVQSTIDNDGKIEIRLRGYPVPYNPELSVVYPVRLSALYARTFKSRPDLIYLASPASLGFQVLLQLRQQQRASRPPVLLNFQTDLSGYCEILFPHPFDGWAVWVFRKVQGYLFRHPSVRTVFYPSTFVKKYLRTAGVQEEKMMNLRRGVNGQMFHPSKKSAEMRKRLAPNWGDNTGHCLETSSGERLRVLVGGSETT